MRLFLAINLPLPIKQQIDGIRHDLAQNLSAGMAELKWVRTENLHITLKFLGECDGGIIPRLTKSLRQSLEGSSPFDIDFKGSGCFPARGPVNIIWLGIREGEAALSKIAQRLEPACQTVGFPAETRPFSAHLTIGRVKGLKGGGKLRTVVEANPSEAGAFKVGSIDLMQSVLRANGPNYTLLEQVKLR